MRNGRLGPVGLGERRNDEHRELKVEDVRFPPGTSGTTVTGGTNVGVEYVLGARAEQTLVAKLAVASGKAHLVVFDDDGVFPLTIGETPREVTQKRKTNGRWPILVVPEEGRATFSLELSIP